MTLKQTNIREFSGASTSSLRNLWGETRTSAEAEEFFTCLADEVLLRGDPFWAYDITEHGLTHYPDSLRLSQLRALVLAQTGSTGASTEILQGLYRKGHRDSETLGMLGRTFKDRAIVTSKVHKQKSLLRHALLYYREAFSRNGDSYSGVNTASLSLLLGEKGALDIAETVLGLTDDITSGIWSHATKAEILLLLGQHEEAFLEYEAFRRETLNRPTALASARRQLQLLEQVLGEPVRQILEDIIGRGCVLCFSGSRAVESGSHWRSFNEEFCTQLERKIKDCLQTLEPVCAFSSAASGGDLIFLKCLKDLGIQSHIVLPLEHDSFKHESIVAYDKDGMWSDRFNSALNEASSISYSSKQVFDGNPIAFEFGNLVMWGLAKTREQTLGLPAKLVALWDERETGKIGGTGHFVRQCTSHGIPTYVINPDEICKDNSNSTICTSPNLAISSNDESLPELESENKTLQVGSKRILAILFSDVVSFSSLTEREVELFLDRYMKAVAKLLKSKVKDIEIKNTWGDAIYLVFSSVREAGHCALLLRDLTRDFPWIESGFSQNLSIRIGLHAGPAMIVQDPVTGHLTATGYHVNRAARIEPIASAGQVYATEPFAAMAALDPECPFVCEYVGERALPKNLDITRIYVVNANY